MHSESVQPTRDKAYRELRELHRLYDKCEPKRLFTPLSGDQVAICACGRLLRHTNPFDPDQKRVWQRVNHAEKHRLQRMWWYKMFIKGHKS